MGSPWCLREVPRVHDFEVANPTHYDLHAHNMIIGRLESGSIDAVLTVDNWEQYKDFLLTELPGSKKDLVTLHIALLPSGVRVPIGAVVGPEKLHGGSFHYTPRCCSSALGLASAFCTSAGGNGSTACWPRRLYLPLSALQS